MMMKGTKDRKKGWTLCLLAAGMIGVGLLSMTIGRYPLAIEELLRYVFRGEYGDENIPVLVEQVRLPRILGAILVGGALGVSGAAYQGLFRNPMVSPDILGVSAGAGFGAAAAIVCSAGVAGVEASAFVMGLCAVGLSMGVSRVMGRHDRVLMLVLSGMVVASLFSALLSLMKFVADSESKLPDITFWLMGSLAAVTVEELRIVAPLVLAGLIPLLLASWRLNVLSFGEEEAQTLGVHTGRLRALIVVCASLLTASVVSITGLIGWIGLIIPHIARFMVGPDHRVLLPAAFLTGGSFMLVVDDLARSVTSLEIPLGILTAMVGAPVFLVILKVRNRKAW
ncbi:MAG: iron ABC transporter permease [Tannerellaceae bacterium]|jgi:iron complex transport system permease protein|nr:iron ABC transporter permease [Tannerellaceae bacterium]